MSKYTHHNYQLTLNDLNKTVCLKGWVAKKRSLGGLIFIDLRDKFGITQIMVKPENKFYDLASSLKPEYVIEVSGIVVERESKNKNILTGDIEINLTGLVILNVAQTPPIIVADNDDAKEETRLKYRYLDLRKPKQLAYLIKRSEIAQSFRSSLNALGFTEVETPILGKSTPEGARDYLVPSRLYPHQFYALPQSPQLYKQLLMMAGLEKYYQVAKCFRDEDLRSDRQPEFTQVDVEASFVDSDEVMAMAENIMANLFKVLGKTLSLPLPKITYAVAMSKYGTDKPDLRFGLELKTLEYDNLPVYPNAQIVRGITMPVNDFLTRKQIDKYALYLKDNFGVVLTFIKMEANQLTGSIAKFISSPKLANGEIQLIVGGQESLVNQALGALRSLLGADLGLIDQSIDNLLWVTDWPLLTFDAETKRYYALHHPFTAPTNVSDLKDHPAKAIAKAYDLVWNGYEIAGGSMRIHDYDTQALMFETLGFSGDAVNKQFGFFVDAMKYGTPPHGGIAFGLDRIVMLATHTANIKDVIAFPKTQSARDLMMDAPDLVDKKQLDELGLKI